MWFPSHWDRIRGFFSALLYANIWARYFFFLASALTLTGLFLVWDFSRSERFRSKDVQHLLTKIILIGMSMQLLGAIAIFLTLNSSALSLDQGVLGLIALVSFGFAFWNLLADYKNNQSLSLRRLKFIVGFLSVAILAGGVIRHRYRENALRDTVESMKINTLRYAEKVKQAREVKGEENYDFE